MEVPYEATLPLWRLVERARRKLVHRQRLA